MSRLQQQVPEAVAGNAAVVGFAELRRGEVEEALSADNKPNQIANDATLRNDL